MMSSGGTYELVMQGDGNLVLYNRSSMSAPWFSNTAGLGTPPYILAMQEDGNLVIYDATSRGIWSSNTHGAGTPPYQLWI